MQSDGPVRFLVAWYALPGLVFILIAAGFAAPAVLLYIAGYLSR